MLIFLLVFLSTETLVRIRNGGAGSAGAIPAGIGANFEALLSPGPSPPRPQSGQSPSRLTQGETAE